MMEPSEFEKIYSCIACNVKRSSKNDLEDHLKQAHLNWMPFGCKECGVRRTTKGMIIEHIVAAHQIDSDQLTWDYFYSEEANNRLHEMMRLGKAKKGRKRPQTTPVWDEDEQENQSTQDKNRSLAVETPARKKRREQSIPSVSATTSQISQSSSSVARLTIHPKQVVANAVGQIIANSSSPATTPETANDGSVSLEGEQIDEIEGNENENEVEVENGEEMDDVCEQFVIIDDLSPSETPVPDANEHLNESEVQGGRSNENEKAAEEDDYLDAIHDKRRKPMAKRAPRKVTVVNRRSLSSVSTSTIPTPEPENDNATFPQLQVEAPLGTLFNRIKSEFNDRFPSATSTTSEQTQNSILDPNLENEKEDTRMGVDDESGELEDEEEEEGESVIDRSLNSTWQSADLTNDSLVDTPSQSFNGKIGCKLCGKTFVEKNIPVHVLLHYNAMGYKRYKCSLVNFLSITF
ncbi:hypothetical protein WR25_02796 isoform D [Diploscapter pachys]|uniref:C2H2-type domain-containing protein n=2 Tax=Diploscapter pachys TaxID=2018661 RepID=A0A2A2LY17_9BILA|nr:hypothetical protein WR25_02796 isoform A [Diploscapter pachys]PAV91089.1 hypothetical protein WR25_02796 isoform D [Diploscapter pachys]